MIFPPAEKNGLRAMVRPNHSGRQIQYRPRNGRIRCAVVLVLLQFTVAFAHAQGLSTRYMHTGWARRDGFGLFPVQALAQTNDGYLWIGTPTGLWRFDGTQFVEWREAADGVRLPSQDIRCLLAAEGNSLWIGTAAGIDKLERDRLVRYASWDDSTQSGARALFKDATGGLWAGKSGYHGGNLLLIRDSGTLPYGSGDALLNSGINAIFQDHERNLWIGTRRGLCRWAPGKPETFLTDPATEVFSIAEDSRGQLVIAASASSAPSRLLYRSNGKFVPLATSDEDIKSNARTVMRDRYGSIWAGTFSSGLLQINDGSVQRFTRSDGLSGSTVQALLEDHDGNIWVGTRTGLDRFRPTSAAQLSQDQGLSEDLVTAVLGSHDGGVWIGTATTGLNRYDGKTIAHKRTSDGLPSDSILSIYEDAKGRLWAGTSKGLAILSGSRFETVSGPGGSPLGHVTALTGDRAGRVWAVDGAKGIYAIAGRTARALDVRGLPATDDVYCTLADASGALWIGYYHGELAVVGNGSVVKYAADRELAPGAILGLNQDSSGTMWVASAGGLSRFREGVWSRWRVKDGALPSGVLQIVSDDRGQLWLVTANGILSLPPDPAGRGDNARQPVLRYVPYETGQGVLPHAGIMRAQPRASKSRDGRLWFAGEDGVTIIDPARLVPKAAAAHIIIDNVQADGRGVGTDAANPAPVVFRGRELQVDYKTTSLSGNQDYQFRYRLAGFDPEWVEAGRGHRARYTNLPSGTYRFTVAASAAPGVWDSATEPLTFEVHPAFYQTFLFRFVCTSLACAAMFGFYQLRLRQISRRYELLTCERLAERARIARDLHDTMLQSVVGASLQLEALSHIQGHTPEQYHTDLHRIRLQVDDALVETRHAVWALRAPALEGADLASALQQAGTTLTAYGNVGFLLKVQGKPLHFPPDVEDDLFRITKEAIANAVHHSQGKQVKTELVYSRESLVIQIDDDGRGFDPASPEASLPGHLGLRGMRERAHRLGADLAVTTSSAGTRIALSLQVPEPAERGIFQQIRSRFVRSTMPASADSVHPDDVGL